MTVEILGMFALAGVWAFSFAVVFNGSVAVIAAGGRLPARVQWAFVALCSAPLAALALMARGGL